MGEVVDFTRQRKQVMLIRRLVDRSIFQFTAAGKLPLRASSRELREELSEALLEEAQQYEIFAGGAA